MKSILIKCHVCGDQAKGINYNAYSCISCKAFFKRNYHKNEKLKCPKSNICSIDISTRKSCPKCRLTKCFAIGMKYCTSENECTLFKSTKLLKNSTKIFDSKIEELLSICDNNNHEVATLHEQKCISYERKKHYATDLSEPERELMAEMQRAMDDHFVDERTLPLISEQSTDITEAFNWPRFYSKRLIKFCMDLSAFKHLKHADQLHILKASFMEMLWIRLTPYFDIDNKCYPVMTDEFGTHSKMVYFDPKNEFKCQDQIQNNMRCASSLKHELGDDESIRNLIIVITLFRPVNGMPTSEFSIETLRYQYFKYIHLLQRYLENKYKNKKSAIKKCSTLLNHIHQFASLKEKGKVIFEEIDHSQLSDLIVELYELA